MDSVRTLVMSVEVHKDEPLNLCTGLLPGTTEKNHSWNTSSRSGRQKLGVMCNAKFHEPLTGPYSKPDESCPHSSITLNSFVCVCVFFLNFNRMAFSHSPNAVVFRRCKMDLCSYHSRIPKQYNNFPASHTT